MSEEDKEHNIEVSKDILNQLDLVIELIANQREVDEKKVSYEKAIRTLLRCFGK